MFLFSNICETILCYFSDKPPKILLLLILFLFLLILSRKLFSISRILSTKSLCLLILSVRKLYKFSKGTDGQQVWVLAPQQLHYSSPQNREVEHSELMQALVILFPYLQASSPLLVFILFSKASKYYSSVDCCFMNGNIYIHSTLKAQINI